MLKHSL